MSKKLLIALAVLLCLAGIVFLFFKTTNQEAYTSVDDINKETPQGYIGSASCKQCHLKEYNEWTLSDHYMAMQIANDSTVLGNFNNATYTADGITSRFFKRDGKFFIHTQSEDGK